MRVSLNLKAGLREFWRDFPWIAVGAVSLILAGLATWPLVHGQPFKWPVLLIIPFIWPVLLIMQFLADAFTAGWEAGVRKRRDPATVALIALALLMVPACIVLLMVR